MCLVLYYATNNFSVTRQGKEIIFKKHRSYGVGIFLALFVFAFFSGVRWDVGIDHLTYVDFYQTIARWGDGTIRGDLEEGYVLLMKIFNLFGFHYSIFMAFIAFCQLGFIYYAFKDEKYIIPFLGVCIMCGGDFFSWMNVMRQTLVAACFVYLLTHFLINKRFIPYLVCLLVMSFIHKTAILLIVFYPLTYLYLEKIYLPRKYQYLIFMVALGMSFTNIWMSMLNQVDMILSFIGYDDRFNMDILENEIREKNFGARKILFLIIDSIIIYNSPKLRSYYANRTFGLMYIFYFLLILSQPLLESSMVFNRITIYFYIFRSIISSYMLFYVFKIDRMGIKKILGILVLLCYFCHLFIQILADKGEHTDCIRYQFI